MTQLYECHRVLSTHLNALDLTVMHSDVIMNCICSLFVHAGACVIRTNTAWAFVRCVFAYNDGWFGKRYP